MQRQLLAKTLLGARYFALSLLPTLAMLAVLETGLRLADFSYSDTVLAMRRAHAESMVAEVASSMKHVGLSMKKDPLQFWVPTESFEHRVQMDKPRGTLRIAAVGCSCTAVCTDNFSRGYPDYMGDLLARQDLQRIEVLNAGVPGYSSYQGLMRLKHVVLRYRPDIVTIFFGWNDHWISAFPDSAVRERSEVETRIWNVLERFRSFQLAHYLVASLEGSGATGGATDAPIQLRVPIQEYEANLNTMISLAEVNGARVVLITAPADFSNWKPVPNYFPFDRAEVERVHHSYNEVVRKVARSRGVPLFDLDRLNEAGLGEQILSFDGVHFSVAGCRAVAQELVSFLQAQHFL